MTKVEILKQIEELKKQIEKLPDDEKKIRTMPNDGDDRFHFIDFKSLLRVCAFYPDKFDEDKQRIGNYFKSDEDAKMVIRAMQIEQAIRIRRIELNDGWEPDFYDEDEAKYYIFTECRCCQKIFKAFSYNFLPIFGYYKSEEIVQQIIDEFKDDLLWYFTEYYPNKDKMYVWNENEVGEND